MKRLLLIVPVIFLLLSCGHAARFLVKFKNQRSLDTRFVGYWSTLRSKDIDYLKKDGSYLSYYYHENSKSYYLLPNINKKGSTRVWGYMPGDNALAITDRAYLGVCILWDFKETVMYSIRGNIYFKNKDCFIGYADAGHTYLERFNRVTDKDILEKLKNAKERPF